MARTHLQENIDLIARHEQDFLERRSSAEKIGDAVASRMGSPLFVLAHIAVFFAWMVVNTARFDGIPHFDPPPFQLLGVIFAFEAILLASFVLMRQSRIGHRSDERDHLQLQVLLLTEKEITAVLTISKEIAEKLKLEPAANSPEIEDLVKETQIDEVAETIRENLSPGGA